MSENKKRRKKHYTNFILFYIFIVVLMLFSYTFSRFSGTAEGTGTITVAKFDVKVNGIQIGKNTLFNLRLSSTNNNTQNNKIAPSLNDEYFELEIDPTGTEVSIDYRFSFDLTNLPNLKLTKYSIDNGASFLNLSSNSISGSIDLKDQTRAMNESDKITIRVYWEWNQEINNPVPSDLVKNLPVIATISQKLS